MDDPCFRACTQFYLLVDGHLLAERKVAVPGAESTQAADAQHVDLQARGEGGKACFVVRP